MAKQNLENKALVWYNKEIKESKEDDGTTLYLPVKDYKYVETKHVKLFNDSVADMMKITGCARHLLDWLPRIMGENNIVNNNEYTRDNFRLFHKNNNDSGKEYSDEAIKKAYKELLSKGILFPYKRGLFIVNPEYFFNGEMNDRIKVIRMTLEFKSGTRTAISLDIK